MKRCSRERKRDPDNRKERGVNNRVLVGQQREGESHGGW